MRRQAGEKRIWTAACCAVAAVLVAAVPAEAATAVFQGEGGVYRLARASDGTVYAFTGNVDSATPPILAIGPDGSQSRWGTRGSGEGSLNTSHAALAVEGDELYVTDYGHSAVQVFDRKTGAPIRTIGPFGADENGLRQPHEIAVGPTGDVFTASEGNDGGPWGGHIARFSSGGALETRWGNDAGGAGPGEFRLIGDVATDPGGDLWVVDVFNFRVQQFDRDGNFISQIQMHDPSEWMFDAGFGGIFVDSQGHLWMSCWESPMMEPFQGQQLREYDPSGTLLRSWHTEEAITDVVVSPSGVAYIGRDWGIQRVNLSLPQAELEVSKNEGLAGDTFHFDAGGSWIPEGPAKYEWDLDGNGTFERSTGSTSTVSVTFARPQMLDVRVRVTDGLQSSVSTEHITVGPYGISINDGATFTNTPEVTINSVFPPSVNEALISNDGGFGDSRRAASAARTPWTLQTSGAERLPKTVYVRAVSTGDQLSPAFTDDIILDQTAPVIEEVEVRRSSSDASRQLLRAAAIKLRITAEDKTSGVARIRLGKSKTQLGDWARFRSVVRHRASGRRVFLQVRDAAGNKSKFERVRLR